MAVTLEATELPSRAQRVEAFTDAFESQMVKHLGSGDREFKLEQGAGMMTYTDLSPLEQIDLVRGLQEKYSYKGYIVDIKVRRKVDGEIHVKLRFIIGWWARMLYVCCPCS